MNIQKKLRSVQDKQRNSGWRIHWIPWWESDKPEYVRPSNPLPLIGLALFLWAMLWGQRPIFGKSLSLTQVIAVALIGFAFIMLGVILSALRKYSGWKRINAFCIDREIREVQYRESTKRKYYWTYRLVCVFNYEGNEYEVTPEPSHLVSSSSKDQVQEYLKERIDPNGTCQLWVNPQNPLHTIFDKKKWWL